MKFINKKYGFRWYQEAGDSGMWGIYEENNRYAIAAYNNDNNWDFEILTRQSHHGTDSYEPQDNPFSSDNIQTVVNEVVRRSEYWASQQPTEVLFIENAVCTIEKETEKAFLLRNKDCNKKVTAWFPKAALIYDYTVKLAKGKYAYRMKDIPNWFYNKLTHEQARVLSMII